MSTINNLFSGANPLASAAALNQSKTDSGDKTLTYIFKPAELGVWGKNPPATARVTEAQAEKALFKHFGLDADNPRDAARLKELLNTTGSPFNAVETKGGLTAVRNQKTGNYEIKSTVKAELYNSLKGTAAAVKTQIAAERAAQTANQPAANPNEAVAAKTNTNIGNTKAALNAKLDHPTMSAREVGTAESLTRAATDAVDSLTGTNANGSGASLNRQAVSAIKATGRVLETVGATDAGKTLQNAGTEITRADERAETLIAQSGATVPLIAQIGKDADKLAENLLDAAETTVKGDFSDKNSTGAFAGRIIGGLNPLGDIRDIAANSKDVYDGKAGSYIGLGGAILGTVIPVAGDAGKAAIRANKEAVTEGIEAALKQTDEAATATVKTAEQPAAEAAAKAAAEKAAREANYKLQAEQLEKADGGHSLERHGSQVTDAQLEARLKTGVAPDGVVSFAPASTKFNSNEAWVETRTAALKEAEKKFGVDLSKPPTDPNQKTLEIRVTYDKAIDDGFVPDKATAKKIKIEVDAEGLPTFGTGKFREGKIYNSTDAIDGVTGTYTKIVWDKTQNKWEVVQHFPLAESWDDVNKVYTNPNLIDATVTLNPKSK